MHSQLLSIPPMTLFPWPNWLIIKDITRPPPARLADGRGTTSFSGLAMSFYWSCSHPVQKSCSAQSKDAPSMNGRFNAACEIDAKGTNAELDSAWGRIRIRCKNSCSAKSKDAVRVKLCIGMRGQAV